MDSFISSISDWVLSILTGLVVFMYKQIQTRQTISDARETEHRLRKEIDELKDLYSKQQDFIISNVATKSDLQNLKEYIKDLLNAKGRKG